MDCVNCGAPLPPKTTRCRFCESLNDVDLRGRVTVRRGTTSRACPRCQEALTAVMLQIGAGSVEIDRCFACHGLFFDPSELDAVLDGVEARVLGVDHHQLKTLIEQETPADDFQQVAYQSCPECGQLMHRRKIGQRSGVVADSCRDHGLWLDGGELRRLIRWIQAGGRRYQADHEAEKQRLEPKLRTPPTAVPPSQRPEPLIIEPEPDPDPDDFDIGLDVVDLVAALGSLVRWLR